MFIKRIHVDLLFLFRRALIVGGHRFVYANFQRVRRRRHVTERDSNPFYIVVSVLKSIRNEYTEDFMERRRLFSCIQILNISCARIKISSIQIHMYVQ